MNNTKRGGNLVQRVDVTSSKGTFFATAWSGRVKAFGGARHLLGQGYGKTRQQAEKMAVMVAEEKGLRIIAICQAHAVAGSPGPNPHDWHDAGRPDVWTAEHDALVKSWWTHGRVAS